VPFVSSGCETPKATGILPQQGAFWPGNVQFTPLWGWKFRDFRVIHAQSSIASREGRHEYFAHYALSRRDADQGDMAPLARIPS
jgi:hypothetical protein